jgi:hypothetical protein
MDLFNFLKKKGNKTSDILIPNACPTNIPSEIAEKIEKVNWADFETAYGNAEKTIPFYLKNLFCQDTKIAMDATHQLWCSLCHQHAYISAAALPSYEILKIGLLQLDDKLKIELLDIFRGFSECTSDKYFIAIKRTPQNWERELKQKLIVDIDLFKELAKHTDEEISVFAYNVIEDLTSLE